MAARSSVNAPHRSAHRTRRPDGSSLAHPTRCLPTTHRRRRRFLGHEGLLQSTEVATVEQPTDHALWNLARGLCVELEAGREYEVIIEPVNSCRHAGTDKRRSLDHRGNGEVAVRITIFQPKEGHMPNLAPGISGREASSCPAVGWAFIPVPRERSGPICGATLLECLPAGVGDYDSGDRDPLAASIQAFRSILSRVGHRRAF
jgi:hypothetical protein